MKNSFLKISLLLCAVAISSFHRKQPHKAEGTRIANLPATKHLYTVEQARNDIDTLDSIYQKFIGEIPGMPPGSNNLPIHAFTVSDTDLFYALGMQPPFPKNVRYTNIRVYLGYNRDSNIFKLFIVPVKSVNYNNPNDSLKAGSDLFFGYAEANSIYVDTSAVPVQNYVMDLNYPCPSFCDWSSRLISTEGANNKKGKMERVKK